MEQNNKEKKLWQPSAFALYTLGFGLILAALLLPFLMDGRILVHGSDGYAQHLL